MTLPLVSRSRFIWVSFYLRIQRKHCWRGGKRWKLRFSVCPLEEESNPSKWRHWKALLPLPKRSFWLHLKNPMRNINLKYDVMEAYAIDVKIRQYSWLRLFSVRTNTYCFICLFRPRTKCTNWGRPQIVQHESCLCLLVASTYLPFPVCLEVILSWTPTK